MKIISDLYFIMFIERVDATVMIEALDSIEDSFVIIAIIQLVNFVENNITFTISRKYYYFSYCYFVKDCNLRKEGS